MRLPVGLCSRGRVSRLISRKRGFSQSLTAENGSTCIPWGIEMGEEQDGTYDCGWTFASDVYDTQASSLLRLLGDVRNTLYQVHKYMLVRCVHIFSVVDD